jgi:cytochrome c-type biogenesis protein CcmH/NrfF
MYPTRPKFKFALAVAALAFGVCLAESTQAASSRSASEAAKIRGELSQQLYSPFCPGKSLKMCPSPGAAEMRRRIQTLAEKGLSKGKIEQKLMAEHEDIRMTPPPASANYSLLIALAVALAACISFVVYLRTRESEEPTETNSDEPDGGPEDDLYLEELREEYR